MMSPVASVHIWIAAGHTDMRRGMQRLSALMFTYVTRIRSRGNEQAGVDVVVWRCKSGRLELNVSVRFSRLDGLKEWGKLRER